LHNTAAIASHTSIRSSGAENIDNDIRAAAAADARLRDGAPHRRRVMKSLMET
jgi:hypothetical protein